MKKGFTVLEILISIVILSILSLISVWYFSSATKVEALQKDRQGLIALLSEARSLSLASKEALAYGVHIEEFKAVLFKGSVYSPSDSNNISYFFHNTVRSSAHSLEGSSDEVLFSRLRGETTNFGTITLALRDDALTTKTVTVLATGVIQ